MQSVVVNGLTNNIKHIAMIMDGNGRWAQKRGQKRTDGHEAGGVKVHEITQYCSDHGITHLTLYAFSTENWKRSAIEVHFLMKLMTRYLKQELTFMIANNIRFETIGDLSKLSKEFRSQIEHTKQITAPHTGLIQILALNYGARDEILRAINALHSKNLVPTAELIDVHLDTASFPPVDMMIRTGGDTRLSNFLLWQSAYAELFFTPTLWPDFSTEELADMIDDFHSRERRFGGLI